jgi:hypothetical protein
MENLDGTAIALNLVIVEEKSRRTMTWMMSLQVSVRYLPGCDPSPFAPEILNFRVR